MSSSDDPSDALRQIAAWADAYPKEACEPMSDEELERARAALARVGISIGALHTRWARTLVEDIGKPAREGLAACSSTEEGRKVLH